MIEHTGLNTDSSPGFATKVVKKSSTSTSSAGSTASSTTGTSSSGANAAAETGGVKTSAASSPGKQSMLETYTPVLFAVGVMAILAQ